MTAVRVLYELAHRGSRTCSSPSRCSSSSTRSWPTTSRRCAPSARCPTTCPWQLTSFVGREREIVELERRLGTTRLLTLTGAGGSGKTRLALQLTAELLEEYPDGVWFIDLAALTNPALVPQTVAAALGGSWPRCASS